MKTPDTEWREVQVGDRVICDGLYTGKTGKVLGVGSSEHSIKLLVEGTERYEPDYALLEVTVENKRAVELLLSHYSLLTQKDAERADWLRSEIEKLEGELGKEEKMEAFIERNGTDSVYTNGRKDALTSIITRYKEELKELESK